MDPLVVEVLAPSLVGAGMPRVTGSPTRPGAPRAGGAGGEEAYGLLRLLDRLREVFDGRIEVRLIEPLSFAWILRVIRYRPRRYPVFVVGGREVVAGLDEATVARTIASLLRPAPTG